MNIAYEKNMTQELKGVLENAAAMNTLDGAAKYIKQMFPTIFLYKGAAHIAIHWRSKGPRYAIITE